MWKHYFKTALRNLRVNKFYSAINITGLAIGLAAGLMLLLWVQNEFSFDRFYKNADHIFRVNTYFKAQSQTGKEIVYDVTPPSLKNYATDIPEVESIVRIMDNGTAKFYGESNLKASRMSSAFVDSSFLSVFSCKVLEGNKDDFLTTLNAVAITRSVAEKIFGTQNAIGKILHYDNQDFIVKTVLADFQKNATLQYDVLLPLDNYAQQFLREKGTNLDDNQGSYNFNTYVLLSQNSNKDKVAGSINDLHSERTNGDTRFVYQLQYLKDIHLIKADHDNSAYRLVQIFLIIMVLLFLTASINYINLSTARSLIRAKEVGIRKIVGARRKQLFFQFIVETAIVFAIALMIAIGLVFLLMPLYNKLSGKEMSFEWSDLSVWKTLLMVILGTLLIASVYPAILLSSFKPLQVLKGKINSHLSATILRKGLVIFQFCISTALLFATIVIGRQMRFIREMNLGYDTNYVFSVTFPDAAVPHLSSIKTRLLKEKSIQDVSESDARDFTNLNVSTTGIRWAGKGDDNSFFIYPASIDKDFISTMKMDLVEGHNFTGTPIDTSSFILNETAVTQMGLKAPYIGQEIKLGHMGTIIGIVKDFNFQSLKKTIAPLIFYSFGEKKNTLYVRTQANNAQAAVGAVRSQFKRYAEGGIPFSYHFLDQQFETQYRSDIRTGSLFNTFTGIAVFISCLGLFGLATYTAQVMRKEIGIRKVLGASAGNIVKLISKGFLKLVLIAITIAMPFAYWAMSKWLNNFVYRTNIGILTFFKVTLIILLIAFGTIAFKAITAAKANLLESIGKE